MEEEKNNFLNNDSKNKIDENNYNNNNNFNINNNNYNNNINNKNEILKNQIMKLNVLFNKQSERLKQVYSSLKYNETIKKTNCERLQSLELESHQLKVEVAKKQYEIKRLYYQLENIEHSKKPSIEQTIQLEFKIKKELSLLEKELGNYNLEHQHLEQTKHQIINLISNLFNKIDYSIEEQKIQSDNEFDDNNYAPMILDNNIGETDNKNNNDNDINIINIIEEIESLRNQYKGIMIGNNELDELIEKEKEKLSFGKLQKQKKKLEEELLDLNNFLNK
ncbi:hypothetical protein ACTFIV_008998 [Dictyostelium citrinum]